MSTTPTATWTSLSDQTPVARSDQAVIKGDAAPAAQPFRPAPAAANRPAARAGAPPAEAAPTTPGQPSVRILRQAPQGAVLEVTCSCGEVIEVHCLYETPNGAATPGAGPQNPPTDPETAS